MYLAYLRLHKSKPNRSGRISPISSRQPKVFSRHRAAPDKPQWPRTLVVRFHCSMYHRIHCCNQGLEEFPVFRVWCDVIWCDLVLRHSFLRFILLPLWQPQWLLESHKACQLHESRRYIFMKMQAKPRENRSWAPLNKELFHENVMCINSYQ
jgi:hypothetical protein